MMDDECGGFVILGRGVGMPVGAEDREQGGPIDGYLVCPRRPLHDNNRQSGLTKLWFSIALAQLAKINVPDS